MQNKNISSVSKLIEWHRQWRGVPVSMMSSLPDARREMAMLPAGMTVAYSCLLGRLRVSIPNCFPSTRTASRRPLFHWGRVRCCQISLPVWTLLSGSALRVALPYSLGIELPHCCGSRLCCVTMSNKSTLHPKEVCELHHTTSFGAWSTLQGAVLLKLHKNVESSVENSHAILQDNPCCISIPGDMVCAVKRASC